MNIKNKKLKGYVALSVLIIMCLIMASAMTFYAPDMSNESIVSAATLSVHTPSALFLNGSFSDIIKGEQNEYIYFGSNVTSNIDNAPGASNTHTGAIKWRVLSKNSGYSSGNWLLWSDYQLGAVQYNCFHDNPNYAFYSTSLIRATLNGGNYYYSDYSGADPDTKTKIKADNSYLKIFSTKEMTSVKAASSYSTKLWGYQTETPPYYATTGIVGDWYGQYTKGDVKTVNTRASNCSASISQDNSSVTETVLAGDYLFLLDYYDINKTEYGFGDNGIVYANVVNSSWSPSSPGYPGLNDDESLFSEYLQFSGDVSDAYWIRPAGRYMAVDATAFYVENAGWVNIPFVDDSCGVRPAFNYNPANVIYATASSNGRSNTFAPVNSYTDNKPAYKVYMKTDGYTTYSDAKITVNGDKLSVEKSDATGSAIILLADKSGSGVVAYQATANFNGSGVATATLPSGVNPRDYSITVLFTDGTARGGNYAESIKGSCTVSSGYTIPPQEQGEVIKYYENKAVTFELENVYKNSNIDDTQWLDIEIKKTDIDKTETTLDTSKWTLDDNHKLTISLDSKSDLGKYVIKLTPKSGQWSDGSSGTKEFKYRLKYKVPELSVNGNASVAYDGKEKTFPLNNYDKDVMDLNVDKIDDLTFDENGPSLKATKAKKYEVEVTLKNTDLLEWSGGGTDKKKVPVEITKKQVAKPKLATTESESKPYTGDPINFTLTGMSDDVVLKGPSPSTETVTSITQTNAGTYVYTISLADKNNTEWVGGGSADDTITVYITSTGIAKPSLSNSGYVTEQEKTYSTTTTPKGATFTIHNNTADVSIEPNDKTQTDATISGNTITVTKAGTYTFKVSLVNLTNTQWNDNTSAPYDLIVKVKPKEVAKPTQSETNKPYTGNPLTFGITGMSDDVELKGPSPSTAVVSSITQTNAGEYNYTVSLKDKVNTVWVGGGTADVPISVTVTKKKISIPKFAEGADRKPYIGSTQTFTPTNMDSAAIRIENAKGETVTAFEGINADEYKYKMYLKDTANTSWAGTSEDDIEPKDISFNIGKATLNITITCSESGNKPAWEKGKADVIFTIVEESYVGDNVKLAVYIEKGGEKVYEFTSADESVAKTVKVTMPADLPQGTNYSLVVVLADSTSDNANGNYELNSKNRKDFMIKGLGLSLSEENMPWIYKYTDKDGVDHEEDILAQEGVAKRSVQVTYNTYEYEFTVDEEKLAALGAVIDTSKYTDGFDGATKWTDAFTEPKTVTVYWKPAEGYEGSGGSFMLTYVIEKAKYDLSNTTWNYTGAKEYNPTEYQKVELINLPEGLELDSNDYKNNFKQQVGDYKAEISSIQNKNPNYYNPLSDGKYIYKDGEEFPWTLDWKINPKKITLNWEKKNSANNDFTYWIATGADAEKISYKFYKEEDYDKNTGKATGDPIDVDSIVVPVKDEHYYWVVAEHADSKNYVIENKEKNFTVGSYKERVKVELKDTQPFVYNGNQYGQNIIVTSDDAQTTLTSANIDMKYYNVNDMDNQLTGAPSDAGEYIIKLALKGVSDEYYELTVDEIRFKIEKAEVEIALSKSEYKYDGQEKAGEFVIASNNYDIKDISIIYYKETKDFKLDDDKLPCDAGKYIVVLSLPSDENNYKIKSGCEELEFTITKAQITAKWVNNENNIPMLSGLDETTKGIVGYVYYDEDGNELPKDAELESGKSYKVKAILVGDNAKNYEFATEDGQAILGEVAVAENLEKAFTIAASVSGQQLPVTSIDFSNILNTLKENWQPIVAGISLLLTIIFMGKGIGYASKKKENNRQISKYSTFYAISGTGLFGITMTNWTIIAGIMAGVAVLAFIFMLLEKSGYKKSQRNLEDAKDEYARGREENMYMRMTSGMNGGMGMGQQGGQSIVYQQPQFAIEDMRGMINEAMSNMLPNVTQYLPQQASMNDELIQQLVEQNAQNEERIRQLTEQNEMVMRNLAQEQELLMQRLAEEKKETVSEEVIEKLAEKLARQQAIEKEEAEKEAAATVVNEKTIEELKETIREEIHSQMIANAEKAEKDENAEIIKKLVEGQELLMKKLSEQSESKPSGKAEVDHNADKFEMLMRNQEMLMKQIVVLTANKNSGTQIIKEVEKKDDNADIIKSLLEHQKSIMDKLVEKPAEKVVLPIMGQPIVQQPAEKVVERVVEKPVPMPVEKPAPKAKAPAPRLTLDEAYAKLSASQKKIFDALKNYALSKDKCKENKSTYFTVLGQSNVNPLVKLTIKKNTTVAMFKMEDEYFKDIRRNAGSDGTKMKVKETELVVGDNQALATAKEMIDLREDQIERYNDYLREQKSMRRK